MKLLLFKSNFCIHKKIPRITNFVENVFSIQMHTFLYNYLCLLECRKKQFKRIFPITSI